MRGLDVKGKVIISKHTTIRSFIQHLTRGQLFRFLLQTDTWLKLFRSPENAQKVLAVFQVQIPSRFIVDQPLQAENKHDKLKAS